MIKRPKWTGKIDVDWIVQENLLCGPPKTVKVWTTVKIVIETMLQDHLYCG